jgi:hypothetical protein
VRALSGTLRPGGAQRNGALAAGAGAIQGAGEEGLDRAAVVAIGDFVDGAVLPILIEVEQDPRWGAVKAGPVGRVVSKVSERGREARSVGWLVEEVDREVASRAAVCRLGGGRGSAMKEGAPSRGIMCRAQLRRRLNELHLCQLPRE